jgi:ribulose-phosphate 3-epimerase
MIRHTGRTILLEVDGGVKADNAGAIVKAGADILVAGSAIFEAPGRNYRRAIAQLRAAGSAGNAKAAASKSSTRSPKAHR